MRMDIRTHIEGRVLTSELDVGDLDWESMCVSGKSFKLQGLENTNSSRLRGGKKECVCLCVLHDNLLVSRSSLKDAIKIYPSPPLPRWSLHSEGPHQIPGGFVVACPQCPVQGKREPASPMSHSHIIDSSASIGLTQTNHCGQMTWNVLNSLV